MWRAVTAATSIGVCASQMLVRVFMTVFLMLENVIRLTLQTFYNFLSFMLQMLSLIPICVVFLLTSRLKCLICGGGGQCPGNRGGASECVLSSFAVVLLFFIFRATGVLDKIFFSIGYTRTTEPPPYARIVPLPGNVVEYLKNDTDYRDYTQTLREQLAHETDEKNIDIDNTVTDFYDGANLTMLSIVATNTHAALTSNWTSLMYPIM